MKKKIAIYPGTFDPVTNGHIDIVERCSKLFDQVVVAILVNPDKTPLFSVEERASMLRQVTGNRFNNVQVDTFDGLMVDYAVKKKANVIVRGIRAISDYEYELQMALMNRRLEPRLETVFMMPAETYSYVSSKLIREIFVLGGSVKGLVPPFVEQRLHAKNKSTMRRYRKG